MVYPRRTNHIVKVCSCSVIGQLIGPNSGNIAACEFHMKQVSREIHSRRFCLCMILLVVQSLKKDHDTGNTAACEFHLKRVSREIHTLRFCPCMVL